MTATTTTELKPCPFCGPVEIVHRWGNNIKIAHKDECFLVAWTILYGNDIAAWNRRAEDAVGSRERALTKAARLHLATTPPRATEGEAGDASGEARAASTGSEV